MREVPFSAIQFPIFEGLKSSWSNYQGSPVDSVQVGLCGSVAGGFAAAITTPLDVTKTRLMLGPPEGKAPYVGCAYDNIHCMLLVYSLPMCPTEEAPQGSACGLHNKCRANLPLNSNFCALICTLLNRVFAEWWTR
eukprot:SAG31_NODE_4702_length_3022_cov_6.121108_3_plen_136_part_00